MMLATSNALIVGAFPDNERGKALGLNGALVGIGLASGPLLGGVILEFLGWRALFWTRLPVSIVGLVIAMLVLRSDSEGKKREEFDYLGTAVLMVGLSALLLFINRAPMEGPSLFVLVLGAVSVLGLSAFAVVEQKAVVPLFDLGLLRQRLFSMAVASSLLQFVAQAAFLFLMPFYLLQGLAMQPWEAGPVLMTLPITRLVVSPISGILADRSESRTITTFGLMVMCIGYLLLLNLDGNSSLVQIVIGLVVAGSGSSMFLPPNNSVMMGSVARDRLGMASATIPVVRQVGISLGITLMGTMYSLRESVHRTTLASSGVYGAELAERAAIGGYRDGFAIAMIFVAAAVLCSILRGRDASRASRQAETGPNSPG
jgi:MFS family permease